MLAARSGLDSLGLVFLEVVAVGAGSGARHLALRHLVLDHEIRLLGSLFARSGLNWGSAKSPGSLRNASVCHSSWQVVTISVRGRLLEHSHLLMWAIRGKAALHGRITTPLALVAHLALVGALAEVFVLLKEVLVAFLEQVHLGEEDLLLLRLRVLGLVDAAIEVAQGSPESWTALLTELAVEDNDGARAHQLSQLGQVMQELSLQRLTVVDVYRTLDVPTSEFVVEAAVDDDCGVLLRLE